jgi:hypothetical protein
MIPAIQRCANYCFRQLDAVEREEAVQDVIACAFVGYTRLAEQGREGDAYASPLTDYAVRQYRSGRRVGCALNSHDVTSEYCQKRNGATVESLDRFDAAAGTWIEIVVESHGCTPADVAATRIDFLEWLGSLSQRDRRLAEKLSLGESTRNVARLFKITPGRVSQLRSELFASWKRFQGELKDVSSQNVTAK